jgi:hypothetical protein
MPYDYDMANILINIGLYSVSQMGSIQIDPVLVITLIER